jgi:RNA polymerase sigma-70 factor, ECF subfamily
LTGSPDDDDLRLARRVAEDDDDEAFEALVARHADRLYGLLHRFVGDAEQAMNLSQETFFKAYKGLKTFSGDSSFFTWLYRIARNVVVSAARYDAARPKVTASLDLSADESSDGPRPTPRADDSGPVERALALERRALVARAVSALPHDFREVVVLRDFEDRSYEEIAELLGLAVGTVKSRLHRARAALADLLRPYFADLKSAT